MNLGKKYKQLFEGKIRSNDATLIKENALASEPSEVLNDKLSGMVMDMDEMEYANFSRENLDSEFEVGDDNADEMSEWLYDLGDDMAIMKKHIKDIKSGMYR